MTLAVSLRAEAAADARRARSWLESVRPGLGAEFQAELSDLFDRLQRYPDFTRRFTVIADGRCCGGLITAWSIACFPTAFK